MSFVKVYYDKNTKEILTVFDLLTEKFDHDNAAFVICDKSLLENNYETVVLIRQTYLASMIFIE